MSFTSAPIALTSSDQDTSPVKYPPTLVAKNTLALPPQLERLASDAAGRIPQDALPPPPDIEHVLVRDDPRKWSPYHKSFILFIIAFASMGGAMNANIFFPAINSLKQDLGGVVPIWWSAASEVKGRRVIYITSNIIYTLATVVASRATNGPLFFVMRILQAVGSAAVSAIGAASLADVFDPHERGRKLGIYYVSPLLGPTIGVFLGGTLTSASGWRATLYFITGYAATCMFLFMFLPETFRAPRSRAYQTALRRTRVQTTQRTNGVGQDGTEDTTRESNTSPEEVKIRLRDVNPFQAVGSVMRVPTNASAIVYSGFLFAFQYSLSYTSAQAFSAPPYRYSAIKVGLVLLCLGIASMLGSILGGRHSDYVVAKRTVQNNGIPEPEMRLESTKLTAIMLPASVLAYGWLVRYTVPIYWICIALFAIGFSSIWIFTSALAFIVDRNPGRSGSAVACNSAARGILACVASFVANPVIKGLGQGWLYTGWAVLLASQHGIVLMLAHSWVKCAPFVEYLYRFQRPEDPPTIKTNIQ